MKQNKLFLNFTNISNHILCDLITASIGKFPTNSWCPKMSENDLDISHLLESVTNLFHGHLQVV